MALGKRVLLVCMFMVAGVAQAQKQCSDLIRQSLDRESNTQLVKSGRVFTMHAPFFSPVDGFLFQQFDLDHGRMVDSRVKFMGTNRLDEKAILLGRDLELPSVSHSRNSPFSQDGHHVILFYKERASSELAVVDINLPLQRVVLKDFGGARPTSFFLNKNGTIAIVFTDKADIRLFNARSGELLETHRISDTAISVTATDDRFYFIVQGNTPQAACFTLPADPNSKGTLTYRDLPLTNRWWAIRGAREGRAVISSSQGKASSFLFELDKEELSPIPTDWHIVRASFSDVGEQILLTGTDGKQGPQPVFGAEIYTPSHRELTPKSVKSEIPNYSGGELLEDTVAVGEGVWMMVNVSHDVSESVLDAFIISADGQVRRAGELKLPKNTQHVSLSSDGMSLMIHYPWERNPSVMIGKVFLLQEEQDE